MTIGYGKNHVTFSIETDDGNTDRLSREARGNFYSRAAAQKTAQEEAQRLGALYVGDCDRKREGLDPHSFDLQSFAVELPGITVIAPQSERNGGRGRIGNGPTENICYLCGRLDSEHTAPGRKCPAKPLHALLESKIAR